MVEALTEHYLTVVAEIQAGLSTKVEANSYKGMIRVRSQSLDSRRMTGVLCSIFLERSPMKPRYRNSPEFFYFILFEFPNPINTLLFMDGHLSMAKAKIILFGVAQGRDRNNVELSFQRRKITAMLSYLLTLQTKKVASS